MPQFAPDLAQPLRLPLGSGDGHLPVVLLVIRSAGLGEKPGPFGCPGYAQIVNRGDWGFLAAARAVLRTNHPL